MTVFWTSDAAEPHFTTDNCVDISPGAMHEAPGVGSLQLPCAEVMVPEIHFKSSIISNDTTSSLDPPSNTSQWNETGNIPYTQELCCAITWLYGRRPYRRLPLPPGPKRLPVIRSLLDMPPTRQWMTFDKWCRQYGMFESSLFNSSN